MTKYHKDYTERRRVGPIWEHKTRSGTTEYSMSFLAQDVIRKLWPGSPKTAYEVLNLWSYSIPFQQFKKMVDGEPIANEGDVILVTNLVHWFISNRLQYDEEEWQVLVPRDLDL